MPRCAYCGKSSFFLQLAGDGMCRPCSEYVRSHVQSLTSAMRRDEQIAEAASDADTKKECYQRIIANLESLHAFELRGVATITPSFSSLVANYRALLDELREAPIIPKRPKTRRKPISNRILRYLVGGEIIVIDIETTGFDSKNDKIIEVGALRIRDGELADSFQALVNPEMKIPRRITEITGIDSNMVGSEPGIYEVMPQLMEFISGLPVFAHNASFDMRFLDEAAARMDISIENPVVDTLDLCRFFFEDLGNYKLETIANSLGIERDSKHRALSDCQVTAEILLRCIERLEPDPALMKKAPQPLLPGSREDLQCYFQEDAKCPYCHNDLPKIPQKKSKCPNCGSFFFVRSRPYDRERVIVTEDGLNVITEAWGVWHLRTDDSE